MINKTDSASASRAIDRFIEIYSEALHLEYIRKPVAWALYHTWKELDAKEKTKEREKE